MAIKTDIAWCDSTLNLQMGCQGCELWNTKNRSCYAGRMTEKYAGSKGWPASFDQPAIFPERIKYALSWSDLRGKPRPDKPWIPPEMPRLIFLNDMGDTFTKGLPLDWLVEFVPALESTPHIYMILTKRVKRMLRFFEKLGRVPENIWPGVSITNETTARTRLPLLRELDAHPIFVSFEPMLGPAYLSRHLSVENWISMAIFGGESGPGYTPLDLDGLQFNIDECRNYGVSVFVKQDSGLRPGNRGRIPDRLWIREFPSYTGPAADGGADQMKLL
jgi:protein gp37